LTLQPPTRRTQAGPALLRAAAVLACALTLSFAHAQGRGGGPGGGGGMMGGGGRMGFAGDRGPAPTMERAPIRVAPQLGLPGRWWDDGKTAKKLGLRSDQQRRMDDIFEANKGNLLGLLTNLQREENHLMSLPPGELQDEAKVFAAIDRVAQARADLEKANAHLMLQIRQQMDSNQVAALDRQIAAGR
jgi:Spy/CpxP family protein refolding chaperone